LDASIQARSAIEGASKDSTEINTSSEPLSSSTVDKEQAFDKEVHKEYHLILDSITKFLGDAFVQAHFVGSDGATVSAEALALAEKKASEKAQKQA
jgi:hypothetical protein